MRGKPKKPKVRESDVLNAVIRAGYALGLTIYRRNVGAFKVQNRYIRFGVAGASDVYGWTREGTYFEVEVKAPGGVLSVQQNLYLSLLTKCNIPNAVVDNVDAAIAFFQHVNALPTLPRHGLYHRQINCFTEERANDYRKKVPSLGRQGDGA